jgi:hypothetical protein
VFGACQSHLLRTGASYLASNDEMNGTVGLTKKAGILTEPHFTLAALYQQGISCFSLTKSQSVEVRSGSEAVVGYQWELM